jgi:hypothetical protein
MKKSFLVLAAAMMVAGVASANEPTTAAPGAATAPAEAAAPSAPAEAPVKKEKKAKKKKHGAMMHKATSKNS